MPSRLPCHRGRPTDDQQQTGPLAQAEAAIDAKNYDKARGLLDAYLSAHAGDARALFDRGYCDDAQGRTQTAEGFYRKAIAADPKQFEARMALGLLLAQTASESSKAEGDAKAELETAVTLDPNPPNPAAKAQAYRTLAKLLRRIRPGSGETGLD